MPKPGILKAAESVRAPLIAIVCGAGAAWRAPSWDRFLIPLPFARVRAALRIVHDYSEGPLEGDGRVVLQRAMLELCATVGAPVDDVRILSAEGTPCSE